MRLFVIIKLVREMLCFSLLFLFLLVFVSRLQFFFYLRFLFLSFLRIFLYLRFLFLGLFGLFLVFRLYVFLFIVLRFGIIPFPAISVTRKSVSPSIKWRALRKALLAPAGTIISWRRSQSSKV